MEKTVKILLITCIILVAMLSLTIGFLIGNQDNTRLVLNAANNSNLSANTTNNTTKAKVNSTAKNKQSKQNNSHSNNEERHNNQYTSGHEVDFYLPAHNQPKDLDPNYFRENPLVDLKGNNT